jgi:hypothetical protein
LKVERIQKNVEQGGDEDKRDGKGGSGNFVARGET